MLSQPPRKTGQQYLWNGTYTYDTNQHLHSHDVHKEECENISLPKDFCVNILNNIIYN